jgi:hypothetical protein
VKVSFTDAQLAEKSPADVHYEQLMLLPHGLPSAGSEFGQLDGFEGRLGADHLHWSDDPQEVGPSRCTDGAQYAHLPSNVQPCGWVHDCPGEGVVGVVAIRRVTRRGNVHCLRYGRNPFGLIYDF